MLGGIKLKVSIILTTLEKNPKTLHSLQHLNFEHEIIFTRIKGLGKARNNGARHNKGEILIFLDSNLKINNNIWKHLINVKKNSFIIAHDGSAHGNKPEPITQVLAIHKKDFNKVYFSDKINYSGEDREFFMRAIKKGLTPIFLKPKGFYEHINHPIRFNKSKLFAIKFMLDHAKILVYHGAYVRNYKGFIRWFFPFIWISEKKTIRQYTAKIFWSYIRNVFVFYNLIKGVDL